MLRKIILFCLVLLIELQPRCMSCKITDALLKNIKCIQELFWVSSLVYKHLFQFGNFCVVLNPHNFNVCIVRYHSCHLQSVFSRHLLQLRGDLSGSSAHGDYVKSIIYASGHQLCNNTGKAWVYSPEKLRPRVCVYLSLSWSIKYFCDDSLKNFCAFLCLESQQQVSSTLCFAAVLR